MTLPACNLDFSSFAERYEHLLVGPLFRPWAEELLQRVPLAAGDGLLDVACGTGIVARLAKERLGDGGRVVGVDVNPQMLAVARAVAPDVDWREGDAGALPVHGGEEFDVVTCHQGIQFFPDRSAAVREMRRVLAPGGRVAIATWRSLEESPLIRDLHAVAERHVGAVFDRRHSFPDADALEELLADAGMREVRVGAISRTIRFTDPAAFVRMNATALVGMSAASATMGDEQRAAAVDAIVSDSGQVVRDYTDAAGLAFDISANLATALR